MLAFLFLATCASNVVKVVETTRAWPWPGQHVAESVNGSIRSVSPSLGTAGHQAVKLAAHKESKSVKLAAHKESIPTSVRAPNLGHNHDSHNTSSWGWRKLKKFQLRHRANIKAAPAVPHVLVGTTSQSRGKPPGHDETIAPVVTMLKKMINEVEEKLAYGGSDDRFLWCKDMANVTANITATYWEAKTPPHAWGLQQAQNEIDWLCKDWIPERRLQFGEHAAALKLVMETYIEESQCRIGLPEAVPCHEGEQAGIRPHCYCKCHDWWQGEMCNEPICKPMTKEDFPFTDCGTEDDGCGGVVEFPSCAAEMSMSDFFKVQQGQDPGPPMPLGIAKEIEPVAQIMIEMIKMAREALKFGGQADDKVRFCKNVVAERKKIRRQFKYWNAAPHKWALGEATKEIEWLCTAKQSGSVKEHRQQLSDHISNMKEVYTGYMEMVKCVAGMARCAHGNVTGMRPACTCKCEPGWGGEHCDEEL
eukprot:gnl/MRDRNA2_/MRDRNA2_101749_c0_seq1.p1 gnl/MRDRNA2_/MRDRNA2_101749_c0~~gnl/MRDRNA2_/MRDRNA2_101749_c0_seq1.p1  ORF type:complete len:476 (-),score=87.61 gnl/MRDRNA2_/MRDRNA2_101749_c0_seq1:122-1549(-)